MQGGQRALERIAGLSRRGHDVTTFFAEAGPLVTAAVPSVEDPIWVTLDPASLLLTSSIGCDESSIEEMLAWEYFDQEDPLPKSADVARSELGYSRLLDATAGEPTRSRAYREFMQPAGITDFLELALRTRGGDVWGTLTLARGPGTPGFEDEEVRFLRAVAPHLAEGARRGFLVGEATDPEGPLAPGLVVVDEDWSVESLSPGVERWLAELPGRWEEEGKLPSSVVAVAARALRTAEDGDTPGEVAIARVLSREGRWVLLHGAALVAGGRRRGAVIVEPAHPARITPLLMAAYGLTDREQDVTRHVLRGDSTTEIAEALFLSPHTVQQHLKGVFEKTGVRSRRELVGKVFFAHYEPRVLDNDSRQRETKPIRGGPFPLGTA